MFHVHVAGQTAEMFKHCAGTNLIRRNGHRKASRRDGDSKSAAFTVDAAIGRTDRPADRKLDAFDSADYLACEVQQFFITMRQRSDQPVRKTIRRTAVPTGGSGRSRNRKAAMTGKSAAKPQKRGLPCGDCL